MRLLHDWQSDIATLTASSADANYPATNLQLPQLSSRWRTAAGVKAATLQADAPARTASEVFYAARTQELESALDFTQPAWTKSTHQTVTLETTRIFGERVNRITVSAACPAWFNACVIQQVVPNRAKLSFQVVGGGASGCKGRIEIKNATDGNNIAQIDIDYANRSYVVAGTGAVSTTITRAEWSDAGLFLQGTYAILAGDEPDTHQLRLATDGTLEGSYSRWLFPQIELADYPSPFIDPTAYPTLTRPANNDSVAVTMPSKLFFIAEVYPWHTLTPGKNPRVFSWYSDANHFAASYFDDTTNQFRFMFKDGFNTRFLTGVALVTEADLRKRHLLYGCIDLSTGGVTTGSRLGRITDGAAVAEGTAWNDVLDNPVTALTTLYRGNAASSQHFDGTMPRLRIWNWDGVSIGTIATEADLEAVASTMGTPIHDFHPAPRMDVDYAGLLEHNLTGNSPITLEAWNDYSEGGLEYTRQTLYATPRHLVAALTDAGEYRHAKLSLSDPNNADNYIEIGRLFLGPYYQVDKGFRKDFTASLINGSREQVSPTGQSYGDKGVTLRRYSLAFDYWNRTAKAAIDAIMEDVGKWQPIIALLDEDNQLAGQLPPLYCVIPEDVSYTHRHNYIWRGNLVFEERK
jgi:hypothetical protein